MGLILQIPTGQIGGKATNLQRLEDFGVRVPQWAVLPSEVLTQQLDASVDINAARIPETVQQELTEFFGEEFTTRTYAVRSSALDEDGAQFSFAGQFETHLHVPFFKINESIHRIWLSAGSERVLTYRRENGLDPQPGIAVIVQEMIEPEVAGVAFGANPVNGDTQTKVISAVYGLGEGLVSGELDADTFLLKDESIESDIKAKTRCFVRNDQGTGIHQVNVPSEKINVSSLTDVQIKEIGALLDLLEEKLGSPQDIEFAYSNDILYLLQTRPITTVSREPDGEYILWDNSNIIESYPGVTTPLTFSFILEMYEMVYRQFVGLLGVKEQEIERHKDVFANTLGLVRGRVYYNLLSWYQMLAMVPGYSINAEYMENMMGVKERFELKDDFRMSKGLARWRILGMIVNMFRLQRRLPKERDRFLKRLETIMREYQAKDYSAMEPSEIIIHYDNFEKTLLREWKAPLINDFFAMIWFGMLQKQTQKTCPDQPNIHNDLLCGSQDIISVEPIHRTMEIAREVLASENASQLFRENTPDVIWERLLQGEHPAIKQLFDNYIERFGNRCVGELKLETISYREAPTSFVKVVKSYVEQGVTQRVSEDNIEDRLRTEAENLIYQKLKGKPIKRWWFRRVLKKARDLVSNRENLRYERTRGFGMVRTMFIALGKRLEEQGSLEHYRDIFYLELNEIRALRHGEFPSAYSTKIAERKAEFETYRQQPDPEERFFTYGYHFTDTYIYSKEKMEPVSGDLKGTGCCPGIVKGKVRLVKHPDEVDSLNGDILVTSSTDPGWVTLFPTASAIIVERGSLLSHSAIVSREMGIPCIVSVSGLLRTLKTGDTVRMDGSTGSIEILDHV